jgi:hypothetical protein
MKLKRVILSGCLVLLAGCGHEHHEKPHSEHYYAYHDAARKAEISSCIKNAPDYSTGKQNCANANYAQRIHNALKANLSGKATGYPQGGPSSYAGVHGFHKP